ncbi:MAG: chromate transporter [bacterium]|nr:chromate transporter [bacterium]
MNNNLTLRLFTTFFRIGAFTFGGGWAMISLLERDIVNSQRWLTKEEFLDNLAISQSLPGILAVNMAIAVGYKMRGIPGAIVATLGTILPSFLIILSIAIFLTPETIQQNHVLSSLFKGIRPAVVALILSPVFTTAKSAKISWKNCWIPISIAFLIWSGLPLVSSPILYIIIGVIVGYVIYSRNLHKTIKKKGGKQC